MSQLAYYSEMAADQYGTVIWRGADGDEVEITSIAPCDPELQYRWPDKQERHVTEFIREGRRGTAPRTLSYFGYPR